ncbi:MAG: 30S ribosome-binding factor RbfA [Planctomycetota bacterium]
MTDRRRLKRLENVVLQTLAPLISHQLVDPRLRLVTVTRIRLSADLTRARVNWSCLGGESDRSRATHALEQARGHLQAALGRAMRTRSTPRLEFHYDAGLEKGVRINQVLEELARKRAAREGEEEEREEAQGEEETEEGENA